MAIEENSEQQVVDVFDLLPNALVFEIFNRVGDARSLSACAVLCKRFGDLVSQTHNVSLEITRRNTPMPEVSNPSRSRGYIGRFILKPIYAFVNRMVSRKSKTCSSCSDDEEEEEKVFRLPNDLLKNFKEIRCLSVKLPGHDGNVPAESGSGALLKWKAEFGTDLESCVILGATGFQKSETKVKTDGENEMIEIPSVSVSTNLTSKQLKKRVVWTISCLIASSARHHMLKQIISLNRRIREVKISDGSKQGTIEMTEEQVAEVRKEMNMNMDMNSTAAADTAAEMDRTRIPAVTIKMWYVPVLELPESGSVMKGATLAVIRPTGRAGDKDCDVSLAVGAFGEKFTAEAVRKLMDAKKSYTLEMNSF